MVSYIRRILFACLIAVSASAPLHAQPAADGGEVPPADLERLVGTLEDEQARKRLIGDLRGLIAAQNGPAADEDGLLFLLSKRVEAFGDQLTAAAVLLSDVPKLAEWVAGQAADAGSRSRWLQIIGKLLAVIASGYLAEQAVLAVLLKPRRALVDRDGMAFLARLPLAAARGLIDLFPVGAFAAAAYGVLPILQLTGQARLAALVIVTAYVLASGILILANVLAAPRAPGLRLLPVGDETANYLCIWSKRLVFVAVYGYFAAESARLLGLPNSGHTFILKLLGLVVTTMLVIFTLQNRHAVADWVRRHGSGVGLGRSIQGMHNRLADVWHILVSLYFVAIYGVWALQVKGGFEYVLRASILTVVILVVAAVASAFLQRLADRGFAVSHDLRQQFPHLEDRANRYLALLRTVLRVAVALATVLALLQAWGADTIAWVTSGTGRRIAASLASIGAVLLLALLVWELATSSIERYLKRVDADGHVIERSARARTLLPLLRNAIMIFLLIMVTLIVLAELGVNIAPLLAGAGVVGLAIGFGAQKLVQDLITGAFILFEDTISVGDVVKLGDHSGLVEAISIRTIRLRDAKGAVHTIPFSSVGTIVNMTRDFAFFVIDVGIAYREDPDEVTDIFHEIGDELQQDAELGPWILEPIEVSGIDRFADSAIMMRARIKTLPGKEALVGREFNRRLKKCFDERGIEMPFPHSTVYFGEDKQGRAPALRVRMDQTAKAD